VVLSYAPPFRPLSGIRVELLPLEAVQMTDEVGKFVFSAVPSGTYWVRAGGGNYGMDSIRVRVTPWEPVTVVFHLDALPVIRQAKITTQHISRWWPPDDLFYLTIVADVHDEDGLLDVKEVRYSFADLGIEGVLIPGEQPGRYSLRLQDKDLGLTGLDALLGKPVWITAVDQQQRLSEPVRCFVIRIVQELAIPDSPKGLQTAGPRPVLRWIPATAGYPFLYRVDVYRDDSGVVTHVWQKDGVPSSVDSVTVETDLTTGLYFWTVSVVDEFGNEGRSREAAFRVP